MDLWTYRWMDKPLQRCEDASKNMHWIIQEMNFQLCIRNSKSHCVGLLVSPKIGLSITHLLFQHFQMRPHISMSGSVCRSIRPQPRRPFSIKVRNEVSVSRGSSYHNHYQCHHPYHHRHCYNHHHCHYHHHCKTHCKTLRTYHQTIGLVEHYTSHTTDGVMYKALFYVFFCG